MQYNKEETEFYGHLEKAVIGSFTCLSLTLGYELGLFDHLSSTPKTSQEIADSAGYRERYVREWLHVMVVSKIVEVNQDGKKFWLADYKHKPLVHGNQLMNYAVGLPMLASVYETIKSCFKQDGPLGAPYSAYTRFHQFITDVSDNFYKTNLLSDFIPSIPGLTEKLSAGIHQLDLGCGRGTPSFLMARAYPNSKFNGVDFVASAIEYAKTRGAEQNLSNVEYRCENAAQLPIEWSDRYDYVTAFDAIHDQAYPDKALSEIYRVMKPGASFSMVDKNSHTNVAENQDLKGSPFLYTVSLFHCMPVSLNFENGMGLGTMWGKEKAEEMLKEAGFVDISFRLMPSTSFFNYHCLCKKPN